MIPANGCYDMTDYLFHQPGVLIGRGPTSYAGPALTAATYAQGVAYAEFPSGSKLIGVGDNGHIYTVTSGATTDLGGSTVSLVDTPKLRIGGGKNLLVFPHSNGTSSPIKYDGSAAPAALGGTPPGGKYCAVYKSRLALGGSSANPNRVYFSPTPDIESTWDTTNSWIDFDHPITGLVALQNALLAFSLGHTERLIGSTPPPNTDMDRQPVGDVGCIDARSIVVWRGNAIFASQKGMFITNGVSIDPLMAKPDGTGVADIWQQNMAFITGAGHTVNVAASLIRDYLVVIMTYDTGALVNGWLCYLPNRTWGRLTNIRALMLAASVGTTDELYAADASTNRIQKIGGMVTNAEFQADATARTDANGTAVTPTLTTRPFHIGPDLKAFGDVYLTADLQDIAGNLNSPTLAVKFFVGEDPGSSVSGYTTAGASPFSSVNYNTTAPTRRRRFGVYGDGQCVSLYISQSASSGQTLLRSIEAHARSYPDVLDGPLS